MIHSSLNFPLLMAVLLFMVICLVSLGIAVYMKGLVYRRKMINKLRSSNNDWEKIEIDEKATGLSHETGNGFANFLGNLGLRTKAGKSKNEPYTKIKFSRAGLHGKNTAAMFWGAKLVLAFAFPILFLFSNLFFHFLKPSVVLPLAIFHSLLGLLLPDLWLKYKTSKRKDKITKGFPDALDLLVVCVEAGMGLDGAILRVGTELELTHPELSEEFKLLNLELRAGKSRQTGLKNLAERINVDDVTSLVTLLLQTDRFGTSIAQALRVYSDTFRTTRFQRAEELAAKIGTKLIFPLVLFIFPSFFAVAVGPALIQIYKVFIVQGL